MTLTDLWNLIKQGLLMNGKQIYSKFLTFIHCFVLDDDNDYHLCEVKSSLINDGPPLNDFDQNLVVNGLTNGIQLAMRPGSVAPRNHVRLKVSKIINKYHKPMETSKKPQRHRTYLFATDHNSYL